MDLISSLAILAVCATLVYAAGAKAATPQATARGLASMFGRERETTSQVAAVVGVELLTAVVIVVGMSTEMPAVAGAGVAGGVALFAVMAVLVAGALRRGVRTGCPCFGTSHRATTQLRWTSVARPVLLAGVLAIGWLSGGVESPSGAWSVGAWISICASVGLSFVLVAGRQLLATRVALGAQS